MNPGQTSARLGQGHQPSRYQISANSGKVKSESQVQNPPVSDTFLSVFRQERMRAVTHRTDGPDLLRLALQHLARWFVRVRDVALVRPGVQVFDLLGWPPALLAAGSVLLPSEAPPARPIATAGGEPFGRAQKEGVCSFVTVPERHRLLSMGARR